MKIYVIIIVLVILITFLLYSSGVLSNNQYREEYRYDDIELFPGMLGSYPSDDIDAYDSSYPVVIPTKPHEINELIHEFHKYGLHFYEDVQSNENSRYYKLFLYDDYKLNFLYFTNQLNDRQIHQYQLVRNNIGHKIETIFAYFLDLIKFDINKAYYDLKYGIVDKTRKKLLFDFDKLDQVFRYVLQKTNYPADIILLVKYKLEDEAKELLDQLVMITGYNYYITLEVLEMVLIKEPTQGITIANIANIPKNELTINQGFWSQIYYAFINNNINSQLINMIKLSFVGEHIYKHILTTIVLGLQNLKVTEAISSIIQLCKKSSFTIIRQLPHYFTVKILEDAITENIEMLIKHNIIYTNEFDYDNSMLNNIDLYRNIQNNFPITILSFKVHDNVFNSIEEYDLKNKSYPILNNDYIVNEYLSFPTIKLSGAYFNRSNNITVTNTGFILITNISQINSFTLDEVIIYGILQNDISLTDTISIDKALQDINILNQKNIVTIEYGGYSNNTWYTKSDITSLWNNEGSITIDPGSSIRIIPKKQQMVSLSYMRIFSIIISIIGIKPTDTFLQVAVFNDNTTTNNFLTYNMFVLSRIPHDVNNLLFTFDIPYNLNSTILTNTYYMLNTLITNPLSSISIYNIYNGIPVINGIINSSNLTGTTMTKSSIFNINNAFVNYNIPNSGNGLITNTSAIISDMSNVNNRESYRIKLTNNDPITAIVINQIVVFGDTGSSLALVSANNVLANNYLTDNNVLTRGSTILAYTMSPSETSINLPYINTVITDSLNEATPYVLLPKSSIYLEPILQPLNNIYEFTPNELINYVNIRAVFLSFNTIPSSAFQFTMYNLYNSTKTTISTDPFSQSWTNSNILILTNFDNASAVPINFTSPFTILPKISS